MATLLISVLVEDSEGKTARIPFHYNESEVDTVAKAGDVVQVLGAKLKAMTGCRVRRAEVTFPIVIGTDNDTADAGSRVDAGATLSYRNSSDRAYSIFIPGFLTSLLSNGTVNADDPIIDGWNQSLLSGTDITGDFEATDGNELNLVDYVRGYQSVRKTRR